MNAGARMKGVGVFCFLIRSSGSCLLSHGNKEVFSCLGIQLTVNFFLDRGHTDVTVFVPSWRKEQPRPDVPITGGRMKKNPPISSFFAGCAILLSYLFRDVLNKILTSIHLMLIFHSALNTLLFKMSVSSQTSEFLSLNYFLTL